MRYYPDTSLCERERNKERKRRRFDDERFRAYRRSAAEDETCSKHPTLAFIPPFALLNMPKDPSKKKETKEKSSSKKPKSSKVDAEVPAPAPAPDEPSSAPSVAPEPTPVDSDPTPSESQPMPGVATSVPDKSLIEIDTTLPAPLSKKEARKHKAKGLPPPAPVPASTIPQPSNSDDEDDEGGEDGETKKAKKEKKEKKEKKPEKFSIWIGNLAFKTSEEQLRAFLAPALKEGRKWGEKKEDGEAEPEEEGEKKDEEEEASITRVNLPKTGSGGKWGANKGSVHTHSTP
jgi:hypothetical protein